MSSRLQKVIQSKQDLRQDLARRPVAEKLRMLDRLRQRELPVHAAAVRANRVDAKSEATSWRETTLGEVLTVMRGVTYKKKDASHEAKPGFVPILRATNIQEQLILDDLVYVPERNVSECQLLRPGDIVIAASSGSRNVVGKAAPLRMLWPGSFGAFCFALRPRKTEVDPAFLAFFLQTNEYRNRVFELAAGVNINNLRATHIETMPFRMPGLPHQRRIVVEIEKQFTRVDWGVRSLTTTAVHLKRFRQSFLQTVFSHAAVLDGCSHERLENVAKTSSGGTPPRDRSDLYGGRIPWVKSGELHDELIYASEESISREALAISSAKMFPVGTVCIALYGATVGRLGILGIEAATNQAVCGIVPKPGVLDGRYLFRFLQSIRPKLINEAKGGAQPNISQAIVRKILVPVPPLRDQLRIAGDIERHLSVTNELERVVEANVRRAKNLRQSILHKAFSGQL